MSLVRFSVAPHETLVDAFYGGLLYLCHVVVFVPLDLFRVNVKSAQRKIPVDLHFIVRLRHKASGAGQGENPAFSRVPCVLKRFLLTTGRNFVMSCVNRAFLLTGKIFSRWIGCVKTSLCPLVRPAGVGLWRFASLIPSGWRLPPIHKVMGDHASRGSTQPGFCCLVVLFLCGA